MDMKNAIITFRGDNNCKLNELQKNRIELEILNLFNKYHFIGFYLGNRNSFDFFIRGLLSDLKKKYKLPCEIVFVPHRVGVEYGDFDAFFEKVVYPPLNEVPPEYSAQRRDNWITERADELFFVGNSRYGSARETLDYARLRFQKYGKPQITEL